MFSAVKTLARFVSFLFFVLNFSFAHGQITFTQIPMDSEVVACNPATGLSTIYITGLVNNRNTSCDSLCLKVYGNSELTYTFYAHLHYNEYLAPFIFSFQIPAGIKEYSTLLYAYTDGVETLDTAINGILSGDVYIIEGQSNALACMQDKESSDGNQSEFIRSFAGLTNDPGELIANVKWCMAEGDHSSLTGYVGQWGLRFAHLYEDSIHGPIAIFNGASGGKPISFYQRPSDYKTNLGSNYARLYYRLGKAGARDHVRGIFWSQGETEASLGVNTEAYVQSFDSLRNAWLQDYPGLEKIYIIQCAGGCNASVNNMLAIQEAQRQLAVEYAPQVEIIPTYTLRHSSDNCHFEFKGGYEKLGDMLYKIVSRDMAGTDSLHLINAPMISAARLIDSTTIIAEFKTDSLITILKGLPIAGFRLENAGGAAIDTILLIKNKIIIRLTKYPGDSVSLSYCGLQGPKGNYLTNKNRIEMVCFYKFPVTGINGKSRTPILGKAIQLYNNNTMLITVLFVLFIVVAVVMKWV
jgi:hypothetical protein